MIKQPGARKPNSRLIAHLCLALGLSSLALGPMVFAQAGGFKNLQILPKDISKQDLKKIMKQQSKALGVECEFCHNSDDMAADGNKHKKIGREMMKLTDDINKGTLKAEKPAGSKELVKAFEYYNKKLAGKKDVTCQTCHNGKEKPE